MHQSIETPAPRTPGHSGDLTRPKPGFNALLMACRPRGGGGGLNKMSVNRGRGGGGDLTVRAITGSGDNSRDLTRRTKGLTIGKVIGGVRKKSGKGG